MSEHQLMKVYKTMTIDNIVAEVLLYGSTEFDSS